MRNTRKTLTVLAALLVALCTVTTAALAGTAHTRAPSQRQSQARPHSQPVDHVPGTWLTKVHLTDAPPGAPTDFSALDTFLPGGALLVSSSAPNPATRGLAHGGWTRTGPRELTSRFVWFRFDTAGVYVGSQRVTRTMHLSKGGTSFHSTDVIEVLAPTGAVVATIHGTEAGTRIARG